MTGSTDRFVVVTGGPGVGKTTLVDALRSIGFAGTEEAGRGIILDQTKIGRPDPPTAQPQLFGELMLSWEIRSYRMASTQPGPVFFHRAIPELAGYFAPRLGRDVPEHVDTAARVYRYLPTVFLAPVWPEIYVQDTERRQTLDDARRVEKSVINSYRAYGYELVELPREDVEHRVRFVMDSCGLSPPDPHLGLPVDPDTLAARLDSAGFDDITISIAPQDEWFAFSARTAQA